MPKRPKFNPPIRRDQPPDDDQFVEVEATDCVGADGAAEGMVFTTARAVKGAAAAAVLGAAVNYGQAAALTYTLETVGITALAQGAYVRIVVSSIRTHDLIDPCMHCHHVVLPRVYGKA